MELKTLKDIQNGMAVFMPSGIRAKLFLEDDHVIVEYPEMYRDKYTKNQFTKLLESGIKVIGERPTIVQQSVLMENSVIDKLAKKGFIRKSLLEAFEKLEAPGELYLTLKNRKKEYLTTDFKNEMLTALDKISKEHPNVKVRQLALTYIDDLGMQEYYDTKAVKDFIKKHLDVLNAHVNESYEDDYEGPFHVMIYNDDDEDPQPETIDIEDEYDDALERAKYEYTHSDLEENTVVTVVNSNGETVWYIDKDCEEKLNESLKEDYTGKYEVFYDNYKGKYFVAIDTGMDYNEWRNDNEEIIYFDSEEEGQVTADELNDMIEDVEVLDDEDDLDESLEDKDCKDELKTSLKVKEITKAEWDKTPKDYKDTIDGQKYIMDLDNEQHATVLRPCKIVDESADIDDIEQFPYCVEITDEVGELTYQRDFNNEEAARADFQDHKYELLPKHKIELLHLVDGEGFEVLDYEDALDESLNEVSDRTAYNVKKARDQRFTNSEGDDRKINLKKLVKNIDLYNARMKSKGMSIEDGIDHLVGIGFDKFAPYKPSTIKVVKELMDRACELGLAEPYDFGRGKGKYRTTVDSIEAVKSGLIDDPKAREIAKNYVNKINKKNDLPLRQDESLNEVSQEVVDTATAKRKRNVTIARNNLRRVDDEHTGELDRIYRNLTDKEILAGKADTTVDAIDKRYEPIEKDLTNKIIQADDKLNRHLELKKRWLKNKSTDESLNEVYVLAYPDGDMDFDNQLSLDQLIDKARSIASSTDIYSEKEAIDVLNKQGYKVFMMEDLNEELDWTNKEFCDKMLGRLLDDCETFLKDPRLENLWAKDIDEHMDYVEKCMKTLGIDVPGVDLYKEKMHKVYNEKNVKNKSVDEELKEPVQIGTRVGTTKDNPEKLTGTVKAVNVANKTVTVDVDPTPEKHNGEQKEFSFKDLDVILKEELGMYSNSDAIGTIAADLENGNKSGFEPTEFGNWIVTTSIDDKWEKLTTKVKDFVLEKIAMPVADGHTEYTDLEINISKVSDLTEEDINSLNMFVDDEIKELFELDKELKFLISYKLQFDGQLGESFKVKKGKKKKQKIDDSMKESIKEGLVEFMVKDTKTNKENGPFANREAAEDYVNQQITQGRKQEEFEIKTNNGDNDMSKKDVTSTKAVTEAYKVYHTEGAEVVSEVVCDSWQGVEEYLNKAWGEYKGSVVKDTPTINTEEEKDNFFGNFEIEPIAIDVEVELEPEECSNGECVKPDAIICDDVKCPDEECEEECDNWEEPLEEDFEEEPIEELEPEVIEEPVEEEPTEDEEKEEDEEDEEVEIESAEQAADVLDDIDDAIDSLEDYIKDLLDTEESEEQEIQEMCMAKLPDPKTVVKNNKNKKDEKGKKEEPVKEDFHDGMLTDVQNLDMPDAIAQTIDVNDDGTVMRLTDLMNQIKSMKSEVETMIQDFKTDMKDALGTLQQTIQRDVNDVDNKVQDTKSAVDNLTAEEADLEEVEFNEPMEEEPTEEAPTEEEPAAEEEQVEESVKTKGSINPIFEAIETIIKEGGKTRDMVYEELRERFGYDCGVPSMATCVDGYIEANKLEEKLIGTDEAARKLDEKMSNDPIKKYLKRTGRGRLYEDLEAAKKKADELIAQGKEAEEIKNAITLLTDNDEEKQQAADYAVSKMKESLLRTSKNSKLGGLGQVD